MLDPGLTSSSTMGEWVLMPAILWEARDSPYMLVNFSSLDFVLSSHCVNLAVKLGDTRVSKAWIQMGKFSLEQRRPCYFKNNYMSTFLYILLYFGLTDDWCLPLLHFRTILPARAWETDGSARWRNCLPWTWAHHTSWNLEKMNMS